MKIKGIGTIRKEDAMSILTREGRKAVKSGDITLEELGDMYKLEMVKRSSKIGRNSDTFRESSDIRRHNRLTSLFQNYVSLSLSFS